jgi:hypothetical protein
VFAGIVLSLGYFLYQRLHPRIIEVAPHPDGSLRDRHLWQLPAIAPEVLALRMDAELDLPPHSRWSATSPTSWHSARTSASCIWPRCPSTAST